MGLAFLAVVYFCLVSFPSLIASNRILRSLALNRLATSIGLCVHQFKCVVERMRAPNSSSVASQCRRCKGSPPGAP
jgi:hypothetical protein